MLGRARWISGGGIVAALSLLVACSSGGGGSDDDNNSIDASNKAVACLPSGDDSTQNNDGSSTITRSHTIGSPIFHSVVTRRNSLNQDVTLNYMVHQPIGTPKGIVVLIAGGALTAYISGTEGNAATGSGGNLLVRSAHRFMRAGYRVITMDRPSDFTNYGNIDSAGYLYDAYRTSVDHAIDITTIVNRENSDNLPVFLAGTSRGAISAVAQNTLAMAIAISSPVTRSSAGGSPVGSSALPVDVVEVPVHVLYHQDDGCSATQPANTSALIDQFADANVDVSGNHVSGGFVDTVANNPCGAFDYHGFLGIENCAVTTTTTWADEFLASIEFANPANARPVALSRTIGTIENTAMDIAVTATDIDDTSLSYQLPHLQSSLGGILSIIGSTVHYLPPMVTTNTTDSFVFTVVDAKGSRSAAVVNVNVITQAMFDHNLVASQACFTCHDGTVYTGKSETHVITTNNCEACHITLNWTSYVLPFAHDETTDACENCHEGSIATGKGAAHVPTTQACDSCHSTDNWYQIIFDHSTVAGQACSSAGCHDGVSPRTYKSAIHPLTSNVCQACHLTTAWSPQLVPFDHSQTTDACVRCHGGIVNVTAKPATHPLASNLCEACHTTNGWQSFVVPFDHSQTTDTCVHCHDGVSPRTYKTPPHPLTSNLCEACHATNSWLPLLRPFPHHQTTDVCANCHNGNIATAKGVTHIPTTQACDSCHRTESWYQIIFDHSTVAGQACNSAGCHDGVSPRTYKSAIHPQTSELCEACHSTTDWVNLIRPFDHSQAFTATCALSGCHSDADKPSTHIATTFDCSVCHSSNGWLPLTTPP